MHLTKFLVSPTWSTAAVKTKDKRSKRAPLFFPFLLVFLVFSNPALAQETAVVVAVVGDDSQAPSAVTLGDVFEKELVDLTADEFAVQFKKFDAGGSAKDTKAVLDSIYDDPTVDMVLATGILANQLMVTREDFSKPTFLPLVIAPELVGAPVDGDRSGKKNLSYLVDSVSLREDLKAFYRVTPFENVALLTDEAIIDVLVHGTRFLAEAMPDMRVAIVGYHGPNHDVKSQIPPDTDAIVIGSLPRLGASQLRSLLGEFSQQGIPVFSLSGAEVEFGALASDTIGTDIRRIARRNALNMQAVLLGEAAADQQIFFAGKRQLTINMQTAEILGLSPRFKVLSEAVLIDLPEQQGPELDLQTVAKLALRHNVDLAAAQVTVAIGERGVRSTRSGLLPQLTLGSSYLGRDQSPNVTAGVLPERSGDAALTLSQSLYSDQQWSEYQQEQYLQTSRIAELDAKGLDTVFEATLAYLQALRAETELQVQQDNLNLNKANLDLAEDRVQLGAASNADVYRWQSNMAAAQARVLSAVATLQQSRDNLNRILNRSLGEPFKLLPVSPDSPFTMPESQFNKLVNNPRSFNKFMAFYVELGLLRAPQIAQIQAQIAAVERDIVSRKRRYWMPEFTLQGQYADNLSTSGLGANGPSSGLSDWNVSINATLPMYTGGSRRAALSSAKLRLRQLKLQLEAAEDRVRQDIYSNLHATQASYSSIETTIVGAEAAQKNLQLVLDAYRAGNLSILDLLDAQNQSLQAKLGANNAVFDFLTDIMNLQRSAGQFEFLLSDAEKAKHDDAIKAYLSAPTQLSSR